MLPSAVFSQCGKKEGPAGKAKKSPAGKAKKGPAGKAKKTPAGGKSCYIAPAPAPRTKLPETPKELPLTHSQRIAEAHYGYGGIDTNDKGDFTLCYVVPRDLSTVRTPDMDIPQMELGAELTPADDSWLGAKEQEEEFLRKVQAITKANIQLVKQAIEIIKVYHGPAKRKSGEPFYLHPLTVAQIVLDYSEDEATILGALLHDVVEDTPMLLEHVEMLFGKDVRMIVAGVTHMQVKPDVFHKIKLSDTANTMMLLEALDRRILCVKVADKLHNMRTISVRSSKSQVRISKEALLFFVPLAELLEMRKAAEELKRICNKVLH